MIPITLNPPASVHAGALADETVLSAPSCAIVPVMCRNTEPMVTALDIEDDNAWTCARRVCDDTLSSWEFVHSLIRFQLFEKMPL